MIKQFTLEYVKKYVEECGFTLLSEEYKNMKTKLEYKCNKCGEVVSKNLDNFKRSHKCQNCSKKPKPPKKEKINYKKYTDDYIKEYINKNKDLELIKIDINDGSKSKVTIKCNKCGKEFSCILSNIKTITCPNCRVNKRIVPYEDIKKFVEIESNSGCKLITTKEQYYALKKSGGKSSMHKLKYECSCGEKYEVNHTIFKNKKVYTCPKCSMKRVSEERKNSYEDIKRYIEIESDSGCKLISKEYVDVHKPLKIQCSCGNIFERALAEFRGRQLFKCRECTGANKIYTYEDIKTELLEHNIILVSDTYKNNTQKLEIICKDGHTTYRTIDNIRKSKYTCPKCNKEGYGRDTEQLRQEINKITKGKYTLLSEYKTMNDVVLIRHEECGTEWNITPHNFLDAGNRCPLCKKSKGEQLIMNYLSERKINYAQEFSFDDLIGKYKPLRFDFAIFDNFDNLLMLIEYDGEFHYIPAMGEENLNQQKEYDERKNEYCKNNKINLLRIPYWDFENMEIILDNNKTMKELVMLNGKKNI